MGNQGGTCYPFDKPRLYEIQILGTIGERWFDCLGGMTISASQQKEAAGEWVTVLTGWLSDQAALNGVLNTLYDRQHTLLYVAAQDAD